jgi:hypothetical protein
MSLSFNEEHGVILWGSEASALSVPFTDARTSKNRKGSQGPCPNTLEAGLREGLGMDRHTCTHRHDLDEDGGEVVEVRVVSNPDTLALQMALWTASGCIHDIFGCPVDATGG